MGRLILALALCLPVALVSCGTATTQTPAPVKPSTDLQIARALLDAQTAIEQAKTLVSAKSAIKEPLNKVIAGYNATLDLYLVYHQSVVAGGNPDATVILSKVAEMSAAVVALVGLFK